jgi:hypothetical protein
VAHDWRVGGPAHQVGSAPARSGNAAAACFSRSKNDCMTLTQAAARRLWQSLRVPVGEGLTGGELRRVEDEFGFRFNPDHRALLLAGMPRGGRWPDWLAGDRGSLRAWLDEPVEGVLFDVAENGFWWHGWGERPGHNRQALAQARVGLKAAPSLVPINGHRFCPCLPMFGLPVLSVVQTDIAVYGQDIVDYLWREFGEAPARRQTIGPVLEVPFWTELI